MRKVATYGSGIHLIRFCFFDREPTHQFPVKLELVNVNIKCRDRAAIAKVMRRYHAAEIAVRKDPYQHCPKYGLRYIALRYPTAHIFTTDKRGEPLIKIVKFCFKFKGFLKEANLEFAKKFYGYQE